MATYILIHYYSDFGGDGGIEVDYYSSQKEAEEVAMKGDTITKLIKEVQ